MSATQHTAHTTEQLKFLIWLTRIFSGILDYNSLNISTVKIKRFNCSPKFRNLLYPGFSRNFFWDLGSWTQNFSRFVIHFYSWVTGFAFYLLMGQKNWNHFLLEALPFHHRIDDTYATMEISIEFLFTKQNCFCVAFSDTVRNLVRNVLKSCLHWDIFGLCEMLLGILCTPGVLQLNIPTSLGANI